MKGEEPHAACAQLWLAMTNTGGSSVPYSGQVAPLGLTDSLVFALAPGTQPFPNGFPHQANCESALTSALLLHGESHPTSKAGALRPSQLGATQMPFWGRRALAQQGLRPQRALQARRCSLQEQPRTSFFSPLSLLPPWLPAAPAQALTRITAGKSHPRCYFTF